MFFVLAFQNGSYGTTTWAAAAVLVWWTLGLVAVDVLPGRRPRRTALVVGTLLALLGVWALVSTQWTADADAAYLQAAQVTLYAGAFFLVASMVTREATPRVLDGIALAIVAIALVALIGRLFPGVASTGSAGRALPALVERLSWPVGYWNGLAMLVALGLPLLLRIVAGTRSRVVAAAAVAAVPLVVADIYLASSRGGAIVGVIAVTAFVALLRDRLPAMAAAAVGIGGGVTAVLALESRPVLVNGPFASPAATVAGREVAALLVGVVAATAVAWVLVDPVVRRTALPRKAAVGLAATAAAALVVAVALSHPLARLQSFAEPPVASDTPGFVRAHLVSGSGSGRWQFWTAAVDQWQSAPVAGTRRGHVRSLVGRARIAGVVRPQRTFALPRKPRRTGSRRLPPRVRDLGRRLCDRRSRLPSPRRRGADVTRGRHRGRPRVRSRRRSGLALAASRGLAGRRLGAGPRPRSSSS